eukprot:1153084-Amphidinium_carterae.2
MEEKHGLAHVMTTSEKFDLRDVLPFGDLGPFLEWFSNEDQGILLERLVISINWLYGFRQPVQRTLTRHQWSILERLSVGVNSFWGIYGGTCCEPVDWTSELRKKFVGYDRAEVHTAEEFTWEQLLPALPPKHLTGKVQLVDLRNENMKELLLNPLLVLKEEHDIPPLPHAPCVWCSDAEWDIVGPKLLEHGVLEIIDYENIAEVRGKKLLNGLFGVRKTTTGTDGALRLIINLVPSNSTQMTTTGYG